MYNLEYRAWHKEHKKYYIVTDLSNYDSIAILDGGEDFDWEVPFDDLILEQSTGMDARDDTVICEGDIVLHIDKHGDSEVGFCEYNKEYGIYMFYHSIEDKSIYHEFNFFTAGYSLDNATVIGNIHEDGDLLRGNSNG